MTAATSLLGLALPITGDLNNTWGTVVNTSITELVDSAIAGTTTISTDADVTLTTTQLAANQARQPILLLTGARTGVKTVTAPAQSKFYFVANLTTGGYAVNIVGAGPTTGVSVANGERCLIAWNGSDFVKFASTSFTNLTGILPPEKGGTGVANNSANTLTFSGNFPLTVTLSNTTTLTLPTTGTLATLTGVETLTNKRVTPRVYSTTTVASPLGWSSNDFDQISILGQGTNLTISADGGSPTDGQHFIFRIRDNGVATKTLTWTSGVKGFRAIGTVLPTSTVLAKELYVGCIYNAAATYWDVVAVVQEV